MSAPPAAAAPAWTTTEFWSTNLVHVVAGIAVVLSFTSGDEKGVEGMEALVPIAAVAASAIAHWVYLRHRSGRLAHLAQRVAAEVRKDAPAAERLGHEVAPAVAAADPALAARVESAEAAGRAVSAKPPE